MKHSSLKEPLRLVRTCTEIKTSPFHFRRNFKNNTRSNNLYETRHTTFLSRFRDKFAKYFRTNGKGVDFMNTFTRNEWWKSLLQVLFQVQCALYISLHRKHRLNMTDDIGLLTAHKTSQVGVVTSHETGAVA